MYTNVFSNTEALVFLVDASSEDRIKEDYRAIIRSRGIAHRMSTYENALQWLANSNVPWLIIADNADDPALDLHPFVPRNPRGHFMITSRNTNRGLMARTHAHHIDALEIDESVKLLLDVSGYDSIDKNVRQTTAIVNTLGHLPLAIVQAAGYIYKHKCLSTYLDIYNESREKILAQTARDLPHGYNLSVATTLEMSFNKLPVRSQQALCILSFFQSNSIAYEIIEMAARNRFFYASGKASDADINRIDHIKNESSILLDIFCPGGQWSELELNEIVQPCFQYSLLQCTTPTNDQRFYSMHVLVQGWLQSQSPFNAQHSPKSLAKRLLLSVVREGAIYEHISLHQMLLPHLRTFAGQPLAVATDDSLLYYVLRDCRDDRAAMVHVKSYMNLIDNTLDADSLERLKVLRDLTWSLYTMRQGHEAVRTGQEAVELCTRSLGRENPITLTSMSHLALAQASLSEHKTARDLNEQTLALRKKALGENHPDTLISMLNFARNHSDLGDHGKSRELNEQALLLCQRILGPEHPNTLTAMNNLSVQYAYLGDYEKTRELRESALALRKKVSGLEHPDTLVLMSNLAYDYIRLGEHKKARELREQAFTLSKGVLGPDHPYTLESMDNLADFYIELGLHKKAQEVRFTIKHVWINFMHMNSLLFPSVIPPDS
jgi:tetratricopeptide (TPR) repeat protein